MVLGDINQYRSRLETPYELGMSLTIWNSHLKIIPIQEMKNNLKDSGIHTDIFNIANIGWFFSPLSLYFYTHLSFNKNTDIINSTLDFWK